MNKASYIIIFSLIAFIIINTIIQYHVQAQLKEQVAELEIQKKELEERVADLGNIVGIEALPEHEHIISRIKIYAQPLIGQHARIALTPKLVFSGHERWYVNGKLTNTSYVKSTYLYIWDYDPDLDVGAIVDIWSTPEGSFCIDYSRMDATEHVIFVDGEEVIRTQSLLFLEPLGHLLEQVAFKVV